MKKLTIAVDFDGTCVTHEYPEIGKDVGAVPVLKKILEAGHKLILYTMRSGDAEKSAVEWFKENEIELWGINVNPGQHHWSESPKIFANLYIDDAALGVPLITPDVKRVYVDWNMVETLLKDKKII